MTENELSKIVLDVAFDMHKTLGPGLFESVYESVMEYELVNTFNLSVKKQVVLPVIRKDKKLESGFRIDLIVENKLIIELKSVESLADVHYKQLLTYLKLTNIKLGLLINFNEALLKNGIKRIVNDL